MTKTLLGKWSVTLAGLFIALFAVIQIVSAIGNRLGAFDTDSFNVFKLIPLLIVPTGLAGVGAFVSGLISIVKEKEWSILVYFSTAIGFFVLLFILGELLIPH